MSKSPSRHLARGAGKIKTAKRINLYIRGFLLYLSLLQCTNHHTISVTDIN